MHKNRSPCTSLLTGQLGGRVQESVLSDPTRRERLTEPPPDLLTPERAVSRGLAVQGHTTEQVFLHEDAPFVGVRPTLKTEKRDGSTVTVVKVDVAYADVINRNGRYYPRRCYEAANARAQAEITDGGLWGLLDHPEWWEPMKGSLQNVCLKFESISIEDRDVEWPVGSGTRRTLGVVTASAIIVETAKGLDARALLKGGVKTGVSTNGWASTQWVRAGDLDPTYYDPEELIPVTQDDFTYFTIDLVSDPSNLGGRATAEARRPPEARPPVSPPARGPDAPQEGTMHELLLKLLEKYPGLTLEQVKAQHAAEYLATVEAIVAESTGTPAEAPAATVPAAAPAAPVTPPATPAPLPQVDYSASTVDMAAYRALESRVVALTGENQGLRVELRNQTRDTIALTALEAARLPSSGTFVEGAVTIDLDASFRSDLIMFSRGATSDDAARQVVTQKIAERRATLGNRVAPARPRAQFEHLNRENRGPQLPSQTPVTTQDGHALEGYAPVADAFRSMS